MHGRSTSRCAPQARRSWRVGVLGQALPGASHACRLLVLGERALARFEVGLPTRLPSGAAFSHATYDQERRQVLLVYQDISIAETLLGPGTEDFLAQYANYPAAAVEAVKIGDASALYIQGCWMGSSESGPSAWDKGCSNEVLVWQADGIGYSIYANLYIGSAKDTLVAIAEGLR